MINISFMKGSDILLVGIAEGISYFVIEISNKTPQGLLGVKPLFY